MKKNVDELDNGCMRVITSSSHFRTDMKAIQAEPGDKSYVDKWLAEQLVKLENQEPGNTFGNLVRSTKSILVFFRARDGRRK